MKRKEPKYSYKYVMLIDDAELDNFINQKIIEASYFSEKIFVNTSGVSALEFLRNLLVTNASSPEIFPQVLFIDINMPIMDGFQFINNFKQISAAKKLNPKLVILTSSVSPQDRQRAKDISEDIVFLNKPLTKEMLENI
jgi:CheY-like chemotaxis protein